MPPHMPNLSQIEHVAFHHPRIILEHLLAERPNVGIIDGPVVGK